MKLITIIKAKKIHEVSVTY